MFGNNLGKTKIRNKSFQMLREMTVVFERERRGEAATNNAIG